MNSCELKNLLLSFNVFEDNEYMNKYVDLIIANQARKPEKFKTQQHHIIPLHIYKYLNLKENNSKSNIVTLHYADHILAHFYLFYSTSNKQIRRANYVSLQYIVHNSQVPKSESDLLKKLPEYQAMYDEYCILNSELQKGVMVKEKNPFYGKKHDEATRKKMREHSPHLSGENHPMYGKHQSEAAKQKISKANSGRVKTIEEKQKRVDTMNAHGGYSWWRTDEYCKKLNESLKGKNKHSKGRKHINNGVEAKMVTVDELDCYLSNGWSLGRLPFSEEARKNFSEAQKRISHDYGLIWVTNGEESHTIHPENLSKYLELGYHRGRTIKQKYRKGNKII